MNRRKLARRTKQAEWIKLRWHVRKVYERDLLRFYLEPLRITQLTLDSAVSFDWAGSTSIKENITFQ